MISTATQTERQSSQTGLWSEYAHQAIVIHAGCALAWWGFSLATQPASLLALGCCLTSGWLLVRQCSPLTRRNQRYILVSLTLICLLTWQAVGINSTSATEPVAIFGWWILSSLLIWCELASLAQLHQPLEPHHSRQTMESTTPSDTPLPTEADAGQTHTHLDSSHPTTLAVSPTANSKWGLKWALLLIAALAVVYMVVVPTIDYIVEKMTPPKSGILLEDMTFAEKMRLHSVSGVVMLTFLTLGGTIGSFLNVFIYRVPRGKPLLWPPSSCASCGNRIHGKDNVPVLGWFLINGRCRSCAATISARYPIIEAVVAAVFIALYYVELLSSGDNIPVRSPNAYRGIVWVLLYTKWDLVGLYLYHSLMLSLLLSVAMMNFDGFRLPRKHVSILIVCFVAFSLAFPALHPVPAPYVPAFATCLVGLLFGGSLGLLIQMACPILLEPKMVETPAPVGDSANAYSELAFCSAIDGLASQTVPIETPMEEPSSFVRTSEPAINENIPEADVVADQASKYGEPALTPTPYTDAAFSLAFVGLVLGPYASISVFGLMLPFLGAYFASGYVRRIPITLFLFAVAFGHQLFWVQIHRLFGWGG